MTITFEIKNNYYFGISIWMIPQMFTMHIEHFASYIYNKNILKQIIMQIYYFSFYLEELKKTYKFFSDFYSWNTCQIKMALLSTLKGLKITIWYKLKITNKIYYYFVLKNINFVFP